MLFTFHLYLSRKKLNPKTGLAPIYAKLNFGAGCIKEKSSGVWVHPNNWSNEYKRIGPADNEANSKNNQLNAFIKLLQDFQNKSASVEQVLEGISRAQASDKPVSVPLITDIIQSYISTKEKLVDKPDGIVYSTLKSYRNRRNNIEKFLQTLTMPWVSITEVDNNFAMKFKSYLQSQGLHPSYIHKHLQWLQELIRYSMVEFGTGHTNFLNTRLKRAKPNDVISLTENEVKLISNHPYVSGLMQKVADLFLLQCYTGMGYSDVIRLNCSMIEDYRGYRFIKYSRKKTANEGLVPLHPEVIRLLNNKYNGKAPVVANQTFNRIIKEVASVVGITKKVTSHVGRKTFATIHINRGVSAEAVTKMLGKTNVKETTQVYASIGHQLLISQVPINNLAQIGLF